MKILHALITFAIFWCSVAVSSTIPGKASSENGQIKVGAILSTPQPGLDTHVAVVIQTVENATLNSKDLWDKVILAQNAEGGVTLVTLKDFCVQDVVNDTTWTYRLETTQDSPFLVVSRAIAALYSNIEYHLLLKNCGMFTDWCLNGKESEIEDFRDKNQQSLRRDIIQLLQLCDGTERGKDTLLQVIESKNKNYLPLFSVLPTAYLKRFRDDHKFFAKFMMERLNHVDLSVKSSPEITNIAEIVKDVFEREFENFTESFQTMTNEEAVELCQMIVDNDLKPTDEKEYVEVLLAKFFNL